MLEALERLAQAAMPEATEDLGPIAPGGPDLADMIPSPDPPPSSALEREQVRALIGRVLDGLDLRRQLVLIARFGLAGQEPRGLAEIGATFAVSPQRIAAMESEALTQIQEEIRRGIHAPGVSA